MEYRNKKLPFILCFTLLLNQSISNVYAAKEAIANSREYTQNQENSLKPFLSSISPYQLKPMAQFKNKEGIIKSKLQMYYMGVPIYGKYIVASKLQNDDYQNYIGELVFTKITNKDLKTVTTKLSPQQALYIVQQHSGDTSSNISEKNYQNIRVEKYIHFINNQIKLIYLVSFYKANPQPTRPFYMVDANTGKVLDSWEGLNSVDAYGPGGNKIFGYYEYGIDYGPLDVTAIDDTCFMENEYVITQDLKSSHSSKIVKFPCPRQLDLIANDAHYFATQTFNVFQQWVGHFPLRFKIIMKVHASIFDGIIWDGQSITISDDYDNYEQIITMDIIAHEISHGFTEQYSGLQYRYQSGGINESFSDIAGETAEFYIKGHNDWQVGYYPILRGGIRYFDKPSKDGRSIEHASDYYDGLDVHYSSGVFNKAFYLIATSPDWNILKAFKVFSVANIIYWTPTSNYDQAGSGVICAAEDLNFNVGNIIKAFEQVGVDASCESLSKF
ncbi:M4 family metallopeptidase [Zooshikella sp. RANM57]|uniref:M4 family metallopeptidase n=1 Tax=Zooshikella sp. RANM57 TaxID=3425863 RepID=UPI003D70226C